MTTLPGRWRHMASCCWWLWQCAAGDREEIWTRRCSSLCCTSIQYDGTITLAASLRGT